MLADAAVLHKIATRLEADADGVNFVVICRPEWWRIGRVKRSPLQIMSAPNNWGSMRIP